jgi:hypothetical protein
MKKNSPKQSYREKIRAGVLKDGNLVKYLTYAAGEIVIVVVGIIVALYLNNWNRERADNKLEIQYYQNLKNQLNDDLNTLIDVMDYDQQHFNQFIYAKKLISSRDRSKIDTLAKIALNMVRYGDFRRKSNIYQTLVNSGEIILINNKRIKEMLESLEQDYLYINRLEGNHENIVYTQVIPALSQVIRIDPLTVEDEETFLGYRFVNQFDILITLMAEKKEAYNQAVSELRSIIMLIDQELST